MKNADMPAMPVANNEGFCEHPASGAIDPGACSGLTKREYFAGLAMQGLLSGVHADSIISYEEIADDARRCADALLAELERTK